MRGLLLVLVLAACDPAPEDLARNLAGPNPVVRIDTAKIAKNFDSPELRAALVASLQDPLVAVRRNAIASLAELEATEAAPALIVVLQNDVEEKVRRDAVDALGRLKDKAAVPAIQAYLAAAPPESPPLNAIWALGNLEDGSSLPILAPLLDHPDPFVVWNARAALRKLRPPEPAAAAPVEGAPPAEASPPASP
jgi:HEAT repeat protein